MADKKTVSSVSTKQMYTTGTGAKQFGSEKDIEKHEMIAFNKFLKNPTFKNLEVLERLEGASSAAIAKKFRDKFGNKSDMAKFFDKIEAQHKTAAEAQKAKSLLRKMTR